VKSRAGWQRESRRWKRSGGGSLIGTEGRGLSFPEG